MVFDKMVAICQDFKWLGFWISDPIPNPDHLLPNLFSIICTPLYKKGIQQNQNKPMETTQYLHYFKILIFTKQIKNPEKVFQDPNWPGPSPKLNHPTLSVGSIPGHTAVYNLNARPELDVSDMTVSKLASMLRNWNLASG